MIPCLLALQNDGIVLYWISPSAGKAPMSNRSVSRSPRTRISRHRARLGAPFLLVRSLFSISSCIHGTSPRPRPHRWDPNIQQLIPSVAGRDRRRRPRSRPRRIDLHPFRTSVATRKPQNVTGNLLQCASSPPMTGNPNPHGEPSRICSHPLDLGSKARIRSLTRRGIPRSGASNLILIRWFKTSIRLNRYRPVTMSHVASPSFKQKTNLENRQNCAETLENNIYCSVYPKITNNISMDS
jgi:hypothetical protein